LNSPYPLKATTYCTIILSSLWLQKHMDDLANGGGRGGRLLSILVLPHAIALRGKKLIVTAILIFKILAASSAQKALSPGGGGMHHNVYLCHHWEDRACRTGLSLAPSSAVARTIAVRHTMSRRCGRVCLTMQSIDKTTVQE
jgi:hypothetical protein